MRYFYILICCLWLSVTSAEEWEEQKLFKGSSATQTLRLLSSTDTSVFAPVIEKFLLENPTLNIHYFVTSSATVYQRFRTSPDQFDVVISSAMDLQLKLVNDGFANQVEDLLHPDWAQWRQSLFGFTLEPASIVVNKAAFATLPKPQSRQQMIEILRTNPADFQGKIGTYDVRQSGLGYLFATQDARASESYWRLMEIMGSLDTRLYCCSGDMIEDLASGSIIIAYNVLGSYAMARADLADKIEVLHPSEFPNTMMRTALIAQETRLPQQAELFLRYLTSSRWSEPGQTETPLPSLRTASENTRRSIISLEPGLMIFLDRLKRRLFIREWESAVIQ